MPYKSNDDLPANIRKMYSPEQQTMFRKIWNAIYEEYGDEGKAFSIAHSAVKKHFGLKEETGSKLFDGFALSKIESCNDVGSVVERAEKWVAELDIETKDLVAHKMCWQLMLDRHYPGTRMSIKKIDGKVSYFSEDGIPIGDEMTFELYDSNITSAISALSNDDFVIEATLAEKNKHSFMVLNDILFLGKDLTGLQLFDRKKLLSRMNYINSLVKEQKSLLVTLQELPDALKLYDKISNGSGCTISGNCSYSFTDKRVCRYHA
jgi:cation transport regulator ChaB